MSLSGGAFRTSAWAEEKQRREAGEKKQKRKQAEENRQDKTGECSLRCM